MDIAWRLKEKTIHSFASTTKFTSGSRRNEHRGGCHQGGGTVFGHSWGNQLRLYPMYDLYCALDPILITDRYIEGPGIDESV